jgi:hypothetical protein
VIKSLTSLNTFDKIHIVTYRSDFFRRKIMTMEVYYKMINTGAGKKLKEILNGLLPGLIPEPVPVRVPVRKPEQRENRR